MADSREASVWSSHSRAQAAMKPYRPSRGEFPDRLCEVLDDEPWESVVDVGCGSGLWRDMFPRGKRYVGLDQNEDMIRVALSRDFVEGPGEFVLCPGIVDGARMPFDNSTFDVIFSAAVLQHHTDADKIPVLREMRRVLKTGGRYIFFENTFHPGNPGNEDGRSHSQDGWKALIEPFGFERVRVDGDRHVFRAV